MKYFKPMALWALGAALAALFSCNDPTGIGSDLLSGEQLDIEFTDTVSIVGATLVEDSVLTFHRSLPRSSYPVGNFHDPVLGKTRASIYAQLGINATPNFKDRTLDSIVLVLPWQAAQVYGDTNQVYKLEVLEMSDSMHFDSTYYSNDTFAVKPGVIGTLEFTPKPRTKVGIQVRQADTLAMDTLSPQLRIRLDDAFSQAFFAADSANTTTTAKFQQFFRGIQIRPAAGTASAGMLSFNLRGSGAGFQVYYQRNSDTSYFEYTFPVAGVVTSSYLHDYEGSIAKTYLGEVGTANDELLFVQGMSGVNFELEFPYAGDLDDNLIVNKAELELSIVDLPQNDPDLAPVGQIVVFEVIQGDSIRLIDDVEFARNRASENFSLLFGGIPNSDKYKLNISSHFQDMMSGEVSKKLLVAVYFKHEITGRAVLAGPGNPDPALRAKLNLSLTRFE